MAIDAVGLQRLCKEVGLDAVSVVPIQPTPNTDFLKNWLANDYHGEMHYMQAREALRCDPQQLMPGARSVLCFIWNYHKPIDERKPSAAKVARYACGGDYHIHFKKRLRLFWQKLMQEHSLSAKARFFVDSAPVMERDFAALAGLGWIGKNTMLINRQLGSYLFIGEIFTDLQISHSTTKVTDYCGLCTACLDACPTQAFVAPYTLDARKCISYLTIEKRGALTAEQSAMVDEHLFGCDICQEVCPWNRRAADGSYFDENFDPELAEGDLRKLAVADEASFKQRYSDTPIERCGFDGWQRNLQAVKSNKAG